MKMAHPFIGLAGLLVLAGCSSVPRVALLSPLGPAPGEKAGPGQEGILQVYSARMRNAVEPNAEEFFWNNDFGRNDFLYGPAYTDYMICDADGKFLQFVRNASDTSDSQPTRVTLRPGTYRVQAEAEDYNGITFTAIAPVVIAPGETTVAHLDAGWIPRGRYADADLVRLPNGRIAGWRPAARAPGNQSHGRGAEQSQSSQP